MDLNENELVEIGRSWFKVDRQKWTALVKCGRS